MNEKMKQDQIMLNAIAEIMRGTDCKFSTEMIDLVESLARISSPAQEPITTEPVAWLADWLEVYVNVHAPMHDETRFRRCIAALRAIPAPPQPGREEIARIIEARVLGGAAWEEPQASCYRAADAILALTEEPK